MRSASESPALPDRLAKAATALSILALAACAAGNGARQAGQAAHAPFPPDRIAWTTAAAPVRAAHARALHLSLEGPNGGARQWSAADVAGTITILGTARIEGTMCRSFEDRFASAGATATVKDIACWGDGWFYVRNAGPMPVLAPAFAEGDHVYVVQNGGSLADVAARSGASLDQLMALNPALPAQLAARTPVLLP
ncbi:LysM peptidoglycan-binding domain-containing protein [Oceanibacterium hippocampi]|uniref:LysM domain-containing protein n=1 Tax=Oceanibacterium hippocampi TaxID=745714 RepID=A0A1Y5SJV3_9PROT|nr:LysM domain-containing protein [Oceanibacterium hippocampi]SLN39361.1 hypothetical protein OCH7691_01640 [Oceanibacterium hippocampi]